MTTPRRLAGLLAAGGLVATTSTFLPVGAAVADEQPVSCEVGKTRYITESSYALASLAVPQTWQLATGRGVTVAVVDSGVDPGNAHLTTAVLPGHSFVSGDPTGRTDPYGHGTAVAGIIAARYLGKDKSSLIGVAPDAKILPVRVFAYEKQDDSNEPVPDPPSTPKIAQGIRWAVDNGAEVVNVSMSTGPRDPDLAELKSALDYAHSRNVVVVASGGNQTEDESKDELRYPAAGKGVIGVAASDPSGSVDNWSVHGAQNDVSAPGGNVLITFHANGDCLAGGDHPYTSWAAGFVSGLAAQLRQKYPKESADQIAYRIMASADRPRQSQRDDISGWGQIQPYEALTMSLDRDRPGPLLPGTKNAVEEAAPKSEVAALRRPPDRLAPAREEMLWWGLAAAGLAGAALVLRPLSRRALVRSGAVGRSGRP